MQLLNLLRPENDNYHGLPSVDKSTDTILDLLIRSKPTIDVVLDSGALVLSLSNKRFSAQWLKRRPKKEAVVYFHGDEVRVLTRRGADMAFNVSPYTEDMSQCLLYLDDIRTRGSDFQLPKDARALVTP